MGFTSLHSWWTGFAQSKQGRLVVQVARGLFLLGILAYLAFELSKIGWGEIWRALPTNPLFYVLFLVLYFSLPLAEVFIYRVTWDFKVWASFPTFVKKRIYNKDVIGYSGEVYFYAWARKNLGLGDREILTTIRDNNIVSSVASTLVAVALVAIFLYEGAINVSDWFGRANTYYLAGGALVLALLAVLAIRFRRYLFSMPAKTALLIFGIHVVRLVVGQALQIWQWEVAVPEVTWQAWFTFSAASIIVSRIPIVPNRDLLFIGAGVELSQVMNIPEAAIAGMLLATSVLGKLLNFVLFGAVSLFNRFADVQPVPGVQVDADAFAEATTAEEPLPV